MSSWLAESFDLKNWGMLQTQELDLMPTDDVTLMAQLALHRRRSIPDLKQGSGAQLNTVEAGPSRQALRADSIAAEGHGAVRR